MERTPRRAAPRQLALTLTLEASILERLPAVERAKAVTLLAQLLLEASGTVTGEDSDESV